MLYWCVCVIATSFYVYINCLLTDIHIHVLILFTVFIYYKLNGYKTRKEIFTIFNRFLPFLLNVKRELFQVGLYFF